MSELDLLAAALGRRYGMTSSQVLQHIAIGDRPHGDARPGECGTVNPRDESSWCREPVGHDGDHSPVASPPGVCGVLFNPPDPYDYCGRPAGHSGTCGKEAR